MKKNLVSIVVLNWNGEGYTNKCLESVAKQTYNIIEVIVVDNGSTDNSLDVIKNTYPDFIFILNDRNLGFAKGMNQGIAASNGEYVVPLNFDVYLDKDFLKECENRIQQDGKIGAIGGREYRWSKGTFTNQIRRGAGELTFLKKRFQGIGGIVSSKEEYVFAATGSFPFLRKKMLEDIKKISGEYYDPMFETGWEDKDLWLRMHLRGWRCLFLPTAFGWHVGSGSVGENANFLAKSFDYQVRILRNRYYAIIKNIPQKTLNWLIPYLLIAELGIILYLFLRSPKSIVALLISWKQVFINRHTLLYKRKKIQSGRLVPQNYLKRFFTTF